MSNDDLSARRGLTFSQAEGLAPLPRQLKKHEMPNKLRAKLWYVFDNAIYIGYNKMTGRDSISPYWINTVRRAYMELDEQFGDASPNDPRKVKQYVRNKMASGTYNAIFDFIQLVLSQNEPHEGFINEIEYVLKSELSAYRVFDRNLIAPITSEHDAEVISSAFEATDKFGVIGPRAHLRKAIELLNQSDFPGSVRESINSVESVAKIISGDTKSALSKALAKLEKSANIHGGMNDAFKSLYGYTSDEKGVRHSLLFSDKPNVDETDALFMIGACSSFVTYLINRAKDAGISISSAG